MIIVVADLYNDDKNSIDYSIGYLIGFAQGISQGVELSRINTISNSY
jgi:hypothetical protein